MTWSRDHARNHLGHYDPAHNAIVVSRIFDHPRVPRYAVDYIVYHEMLHLKHPVKLRGSRRCVHSAEFQAEEKLFPQLEEVKRFLRISRHVAPASRRLSSRASRPRNRGTALAEVSLKGIVSGTKQQTAAAKARLVLRPTARLKSFPSQKLCSLGLRAKAGPAPQPGLSIDASPPEDYS